MSRQTLFGILRQPAGVVPPTTPIQSNQAFDGDESALGFQLTGGIAQAEREVDAIAAKANLQFEANTKRKRKIIHVPYRAWRKTNEQTIYEHLTNPMYGTCFARPVAFLNGLEDGQDRLAAEKKWMFTAKNDLNKLIEIREGLIGVELHMQEFCGDKNALYIPGHDAIMTQHIVAYNVSGDKVKEEKALEASRNNLKRMTDEMQDANEETVLEGKRLKAHVEAGGILIAPEPIDLEKYEGTLSAAIREACEKKTAEEAAHLEAEIKLIEHYKLKAREIDARYKDLCRAHMLVYLELKREGWDNIPMIYRRPGYWFN